MSQITDFITVNAGDGYDIELTVTENGEVKIVSIDANSFTPCSAEIPLSKEKAVEFCKTFTKFDRLLQKMIAVCVKAPYIP